MDKLKLYLKLTRPDHWFKNVFIIPGFLLAYIFTPVSTHHLVEIVLIGLISSCFICSANYIINEWLDREFDKFHPVKKNRPAVTDSLNVYYIALEYFLFMGVGLVLAWQISIPFLITSIVLLLMGAAYNIKPLRTKDWVYFDVLSESINNPIRLLLGWFMVSSLTFPPVSLLLSYWMGGAFLMGIKRLSELRFIAEPVVAGLYRRSFKYYSNENLLVSSFFYAICSAFFGGVFLLKYKVELIFTFPFYAILFAWYFFIGLKPNSAAQCPERIYQEKYFLLFVVFVVVLTLFFIFINPISMQWSNHFFLAAANG